MKGKPAIQAGHEPKLRLGLRLPITRARLLDGGANRIVSDRCIAAAAVELIKDPLCGLCGSYQGTPRLTPRQIIIIGGHADQSV